MHLVINPVDTLWIVLQIHRDKENIYNKKKEFFFSILSFWKIIEYRFQVEIHIPSIMTIPCNYNSTHEISRNLSI